MLLNPQEAALTNEISSFLEAEGNSVQLGLHTKKTNITGSLPRRNRPIKSLWLREETHSRGGNCRIAGCKFIRNLKRRKEKGNRWSVGPKTAERFPVRHTRKCSGRCCEERTQPLTLSSPLPAGLGSGYNLPSAHMHYYPKCTFKYRLIAFAL